MRESEVHAPRGGTSLALHDMLTLGHLHVAGRDCVTALEERAPWRRRLHHATFYGFMLCFASTCVATLYHLAGSAAPYAYTSLPVVLGTLGGLGLAFGTAGAIGKAQAAAEQALSQARVEASRSLGEASGNATRAIEAK